MTAAELPVQKVLSSSEELASSGISILDTYLTIVVLWKRYKQ